MALSSSVFVIMDDPRPAAKTFCFLAWTFSPATAEHAVVRIVSVRARRQDNCTRSDREHGGPGSTQECGLHFPREQACGELRRNEPRAS